MKKIIKFTIVFMSLFIFTACDSSNKEYENTVIIRDKIDEINNKVTEEDIRKQKETFENYNVIKECDIRVVGKIVYVKLHFDDSVSLSSAKVRCNGPLSEAFDEYDLEYEIYNDNFHVIGRWIEDYNMVAWADTYGENS